MKRRLLPTLLLAVLPALPAQAATFTVTKTADTLDGVCDRDCSLREAVSAANASEPEGGFDVVVVPPGVYVLTRTGAAEEGSATGDLDLSDHMYLVGAGPGSTVIDGFGFDRVLDLRAPAEVYGVTIRNGRAEGHGGGVLARKIPGSQPVLFRNVVISGNQAQRGGSGGGIAAFGFVEVRESAVVENHAEGDGGGISSGEDGTFHLTNVTVSGNLAHGSGGGLFYAAVTSGGITASTIAFNQAHVSGGGIWARPAPFPVVEDDGISGTIIAQNTAPAEPDCGGAVATIGFNVIGVGTCFTGPNDRVGTEASPLLPVAEGLRSDLGPTPVHALAENSPARHFVPAELCPPADQVGQDRPAPCDAGAWEEPGVLDVPACVPGGSVLCLGGYRVSAVWRQQPEQPGTPAHAAALTHDTGNFWFFSPDNLEVTVKVLSGCGLNDRVWVFASGLTNLGVDLKVEDLLTGATWTHEHPPGATFAPRLDTNALPCPPGLGVGDKRGEPRGAAGLLPAAVLRVTKTADTDDGACDHDCSLREAVIASNALRDTGVILVGPGVHPVIRPGAGENAARTGDLDVTERLVILGAGADRTRLDGGAVDRILEVRARASLEIYDIGLSDGWARPDPDDGSGGAIRATGDLLVVRADVKSNRAELCGGGIAAFGRLTVRDSTIRDNFSVRFGGGLCAGTLELENVTVSGNRAEVAGGGLFLPIDAAFLRNATFTGNRSGLGGGIAVDEPTCAGGIRCFGPLVVERSAVAGNLGEGGVPDDCFDLSSPDGGFNLFGVGAGCSPDPDDRFGTLAHPLDPRLSPLGDHGGPTPTHLPLEDSPLLDAAPASTCGGADQRGRPRPVNGCDIGAVERLPACQPDADTLCLGEGDRFRVEVRWTAQGNKGAGQAVPLALDTGAVWFFGPENLELTVKVLNGCGLNQRWWVFLSGLTNVGVEVTVEDTRTGETWSHTHAEGAPLQPRLDTGALECVNL